MLNLLQAGAPGPAISAHADPGWMKVMLMQTLIAGQEKEKECLAK